MEKDELRGVILDTMEVSLAAQLRAVRRLRGVSEKEESPERGMSHVDMVQDVLIRARGPLHILRIIEDVEKIYGIKIERESIVSALSKKVMKEDRFIRTAKNTFALKEG